MQSFSIFTYLLNLIYNNIIFVYARETIIYMKWLAKHTQVQPKEGETRLKRCFAFLPVRINDTFVWLETYEVLQLFYVKQYNATIEGKAVIFKHAEWINLSKRIIE